MSMDIFTDDPIDLTKQRLQEAPGEEDRTLKEAGHDEMWRSFLGRMFEEGWDHATRGAKATEKTASSDDPYQEGQKEALQKIAALHQDSYARGFYHFLKHAHDERGKGEDPHDIAKEALERNSSSRIEEGFLGAAEAVLASELEKVAWEGPQSYSTDDGDPMSEQNPFVMGKKASFQELVEGAQEGVGFADCLSWASQTVDRDLEKNASEEAVDFRLGTEAVCYGLHKCASAMDGNYPIEDEDAALEMALEKVATGEPVPELPDNEAYRLGKEAAFRDLAKRYDEGQKIGDVLGDVKESLESNLKEASQERRIAQRGVDNVCFSFLEKAATLYGNYRAEDEEDQRKLFKVALEEVAKEDEAALKEAQQPQEEEQQGMSRGQKAGLAAGGTLGAGALAQLLRHGGKGLGNQPADASAADKLKDVLGATAEGTKQDVQSAGRAGQAGLEALKGKLGLGKSGSYNPDQLAKEAGLMEEDTSSDQEESEQTGREEVAEAFDTLKEAGAFADGSLEELEAKGLLDD